jgi:hypothetical protein
VILLLYEEEEEEEEEEKLTLVISSCIKSLSVSSLLRVSSIRCST